jgi:hypothetical protein
MNWETYYSPDDAIVEEHEDLGYDTMCALLYCREAGLHVVNYHETARIVTVHVTEVEEALEWSGHDLRWHAHGQFPTPNLKRLVNLIQGS